MEIVFEFQEYVVDSMLYSIAYIQAMHATQEVCETFTEYHEGVWYNVNLCVQILGSAIGGN